MIARIFEYLVYLYILNTWNDAWHIADLYTNLLN
jgi:hypothetical protein